MAERAFTTLLPDGPTWRDRLGFERVLAALDAVVFSRESLVTPLTIGIYGSWGSGKSSLLKQIRKALDPNDGELWPDREKASPKHDQAKERSRRLLTIQFSPWTYQHERTLLLPLLLSLMQARRFAQKTVASLTQEAGKIAKVTSRFLVERVLLPGVAEEIGEIGKEEEEKAREGQPDMTLSEVTRLQQMVGQFVKKVRGNRTLVILIDDLDRCHPPKRIVELLEQIKVFLSVEGCIFVLACDRDVVVKAIESKFPGQGEAYLEKFVQIPVPLPRPQSPQIADLIPGFQAETGAGQDRDEEWLGYLEHVAAALGNNPRRFKRFYNTFVLARNALQAATAEEKAENDAQKPPPTVDNYLLAKWVLLRETSQTIARNPLLVLELEQRLPAEGRFDIRAVQEEFGLSQEVWRFVQLDSARRFGNIQTLMLYVRLTGRDLDISREEVEARVAAGQPIQMDLSGLNLSRAWLPNADFAGCTLIKTSFRYANIDGAKFNSADLQQAIFTKAKFRQVSLKAVKNFDTIVCEDRETLERLLDQQRAQNLEPGKTTEGKSL